MKTIHTYKTHEFRAKPTLLNRRRIAIKCPAPPRILFQGGLHRGSRERDQPRAEGFQVHQRPRHICLTSVAGASAASSHHIYTTGRWRSCLIPCGICHFMLLAGFLNIVPLPMAGGWVHPGLFCAYGWASTLVPPRGEGTCRCLNCLVALLPLHPWDVATLSTLSRASVARLQNI